MSTQWNKSNGNAAALHILWKDFFKDPCLWYRNHSTKKCLSAPDFTHKTTNECLWAHGCFNPSWISEEFRRRVNVLSKNVLERVENDEANTKKEYFTLTALLKVCAKERDIYTGIRVHTDIQKKRLLGKYPYLGSSLIKMYARCGMLEKAQRVHEELHVRDIVSWSALITGYTHLGKVHEAFNTLEQMQSEGLSPNAFTLASVLKACGSVRGLCKGKEIHEVIMTMGLLEKDIVLGTALVDMYAKCGLLTKAHDVLEELPIRNVISWTALISGYCEHKQAHQALNCFYQMQNEGLPPNATTFVSILQACGTVGIVNEGKHIHEEIVSSGLLEKHNLLGNALVDMYAKFGMLAKSLEVLKSLLVRNVISWNALIAGYAQQGRCHEAKNCFQQMQSEGISPDAATYTCMLKVSGSAGDIVQGNQIHGEIVGRGLLAKDIVLGNALVDMYAKCGTLNKAQHMFEELPHRDIISWNALISGYVQHGQWYKALNIFEQMQTEGICPNAVTYICILKACSSNGAIDKGNQIHDEVVSRGLLERDIGLGTALVDLYAKCGALSKAQHLLEELPIRNLVSWCALMAGYVQHGQGCNALNCFERMQREGLSPNDVVLLCALNACGHSGLFNEAQMLFEDMIDKYGITPSLEHYTGLMVVFGFAGHFDKMMSMTKVMPSSNCLGIWLAILDACRKWGNSMLGNLAFDQALLIDPSCAIT